MLQLSNSTTKATVAIRIDAIVLKKMFVLLVISAFSLSRGNAQQIFIGGNFGVFYNDGKSVEYGTTNDLPSNFQISFAPMAGYYINGNTAIGLKVNLGGGTMKDFLYESELIERKTNTFQWGVAAFSRYNVWEQGKFSVTFEGSLGIGGISATIKNGAQTNKGNPLSTFSINVVPLLSYSLTDRLSIESQFNFLNLGYSTRIEKDILNLDKKTTQNSFGFGINNSWEPFNWRVGFIFKI